MGVLLWNCIVFWFRFFKFGFSYDLGLGILIGLDWIAFMFWLRFGLNKKFGLELFLILVIYVRFGISFGYLG